MPNNPISGVPKFLTKKFESIDKENVEKALA